MGIGVDARGMRLMRRRFGHDNIVVVELGGLGITRYTAPERATAHLICKRRIVRIVLNGMHAIKPHALRVASCRRVRPDEQDGMHRVVIFVVGDHFIDAGLRVVSGIIVVAVREDVGGCGNTHAVLVHQVDCDGGGGRSFPTINFR